MDVVWPAALVPDSFSFTYQANSNKYQSVFTGDTQTAAFPGAHFKCTLGLKDLNNNESKLLMSFIAKMNGVAGRVQLWDVSVKGKPAKGTPLISGATGNLTTLATKGWTPNTVILKEGDYVSFGSGPNLELKIVTADVTSSATGTATIPVMPWIRNYPATNSAVEVENPKGRFRFINDENGKDVSYYDQHSYSLEFVEAFYG